MQVLLSCRKLASDRRINKSLKIISFSLERLTNDSARLVFRECEHTLFLDEELSVKDLNYQLKDLCQRNQDGSRATQAERFQLLQTMASHLN